MSKRLVALFGTGVIVLAACGAPASPQASPTATGPAATATPPTGGLDADQILTLYLSSDDPATLDPNAAQDNVSLTVLSATQRGLLYFDKDLNTVPSLAESFEISPDAKTWTFKLRDAKYSNGDPILASDLVFGWRRLVDVRQANPYSYVLSPVEGADEALGLAADADTATIDAALEGLGVEAPDEKTFIVHLARPATYFGAIVAMWIAVPIQQKWVETPNFTEAENYLASGPFTIESWAHNSEIVLVPNTNWYGDVKPTLTEIHLKIGGDPAAALAEYERGGYDAIDTTGAGSAEVRRVGADPKFADQRIDSPQLGITYYNFNTCIQPVGPVCEAHADIPGGAPTANKNFRAALSQAVNKQTFIDLTFGGLGLVANTMVMPGLPGYTTYDPYPFDPAAAQEKMATALTELGITTDLNGDEEVNAGDIPGVLKFGYNKDAGHLPRVAFLAEAFRTTFGFSESQFDIIGTDFPTFLQARTSGSYEISRNGWGADFASSFNQLDGLFTCGGGNNDQQWCNEEFDSLLQQASVEQDQATAADLYEQAQKIMLDDAVAVFLRYGVSRYLVQTYVSNYFPTANDFIIPGDRFPETIQILEH